ncbi:MFS transporter [Peribacillus frigoritolerans]|uniref:MFS transporter n=1 Tax=Peribacillus frigoritolerans TaxID=450367 RepID=UPI0039A0DC39
MNTKWSALIFAFIITAVMYIPYIGYSIGAIDIIEEFSISYASVGLLATSTAIVGGLMLPYAGFLTDKLGPKKIILFGLGTLVIGQLLFGIATSFTILIVARVIVGIGVAILLIAPYTLVIHWFEDSKSTGLGLGIMIGTDGIGSLLATYVFAITFTLLGWRINALISSIVLLSVLTITWKSLKDSNTFKPNREVKFKLESVLELLKERNVIAGAIYLTGLFSVFNLAVFWIPTILMEEKNWSEGLSGFIGSTFALAGILGSFIFGAYSDKLKKRKVFIMVANLGMLIAFVGFSYFYSIGNYVALAILLPIAGFFGYGGPAVTYSLTAESIDKSKVGLANGLVLGIGMLIGGSIVPVLVGYLKDLFGEYTIGFLIIGGYLLIFSILNILLLKDVNEIQIVQSKEMNLTDQL